MDHRAGAKEEQGLEKRVRHQVEYPGAERAHPAGQEHISQLADGRISQDALDIVLSQSDSSRKERRRRTNYSDDHKSIRSHHIENIGASNHIYAGGHHGGSVYQRRDGRRTFHSIRQPDIKRNLGRFPRSAHKQTQTSDRYQPTSGRKDHRCILGDGNEIQRPDIPKDYEHTDQETEITYPVNNERLFAGV